jgi:hypothetical protein
MRFECRPIGQRHTYSRPGGTNSTDNNTSRRPEVYQVTVRNSSNAQCWTCRCRHITSGVNGDGEIVVEVGKDRSVRSANRSWQQISRFPGHKPERAIQQLDISLLRIHDPLVSLKRRCAASGCRHARDIELIVSHGAWTYRIGDEFDIAQRRTQHCALEKGR